MATPRPPLFLINPDDPSFVRVGDSEAGLLGTIESYDLEDGVVLYDSEGRRAELYAQDWGVRVRRWSDDGDPAKLKEDLARSLAAIGAPDDLMLRPLDEMVPDAARLIREHERNELLDRRILRALGRLFTRRPLDPRQKR